MTDNQITGIPAADLLGNCIKLKKNEYRIVQICAVRTQDGYELTYSFAKEYDMVNLRVQILVDEEIASISDIFSPAFLYENEIRDLFGVKIQMINFDYRGNLYRIDTETPFKQKG